MVTGSNSDMSVREFFEQNEAFRKHYASMFLNCRDRPLASYIWYSVHCRTAYMIAVSLREISPFVTPEFDDPEVWEEFRGMRGKYVEYSEQFRADGQGYKSSAATLALFRSRIPVGADGEPVKFERVLSLNPEELTLWLNKSVFTFAFRTPMEDELSENDPVRQILREEGAEDEVPRWKDLDPIGTLSFDTGDPSDRNVQYDALSAVPQNVVDAEIHEASDEVKRLVVAADSRSSAMAMKKVHEKKVLERKIKAAKIEQERADAEAKAKAATQAEPLVSPLGVPPPPPPPPPPPANTSEDVDMRDAISKPVPEDMNESEEEEADDAGDEAGEDAEMSPDDARTVTTQRSEQLTRGAAPMPKKADPERNTAGRFFHRMSEAGSEVTSSAASSRTRISEGSSR